MGQGRRGSASSGCVDDADEGGRGDPIVASHIAKADAEHAVGDAPIQAASLSTGPAAVAAR